MLFRCWFLYFLVLCSSSRLQAQDAKGLQLLRQWDDTLQCPANPAGQHWNNVWGYVQDGKEYAIIGGTLGIHIIDIDADTQVTYLPLSAEAAVHRDFKTYRQHLYCISGEGNDSRLQAFDLSGIPGPVKRVWESNPDTLSRAQCLFIDTTRARLYLGTAVGNQSGTHDLTVYSLAHPDMPVFLSYADGFGQTHGLYVRHDTAWCSNGWDGFALLGMSRLPTLQALGGLSQYPYSGYNHSNWIGPAGIGVMSDEGFGLPLKVIDTRRPANIQVLSNFSVPGNGINSMPHNPYLLGSLCFVAYYQDGLQVFDLSNPLQPERVGYYDTYPEPSGQKYAGAWACFPYLPSRRILVSDMQHGLFVLDASELLAAPSAHRQAVISVFPNPAGQVLHVRLSRPLCPDAGFKILDAAGRNVQEGRVTDSRADADLNISLPAALTPGTYVLRLSCGAELFSARFTKP
ncbi:MAG: choice-of-anchor B family protein [Bacteroidetes bacterium]|nr:choice-of-anchor B family protein [Bacteroidota bacterium]